MRRMQEEIPTREELPVRLASPETGLTAEEARRRAEAGYANAAVTPPTRTVKQILASNLLTFFNLLFVALAACVAAVMDWSDPDWLDLSFLLVVLINAAIGIVQELRSKRSLDRLTLLSAPKATVVRDGETAELPAEETVRDDVVIIAAGDQIYADGVVLSGQVSVNEALVTGESDEIAKQPGDALLSGSFAVSGRCRARLTAVGEDSFVSRLTREAKQSKKRREPEMMRALTRLIRVVGFIVLPFGVLMAVKEISWLGRDLSTGVRSTVASLTGMIPEGLYLLTSVALAAGALRLARRKTLLHELGCIETLARVDVLCADKTGTITENKMVVENVVSLCPERYTEDDIRLVMADYVFAMQSDNDTMAALRRYFSGTATQTALDTLPFTSARKYGGVAFHEDEVWLLGAPEILLGSEMEAYRERIDRYSAGGCRVLLLANYDGRLTDQRPDAPKLPVALILLSNKLRPEAPETFRYFAEQGVAVKVISGDNPLTVSEVAKRAEIPGAERYVDARTLRTEGAIQDAAENYTVFGRVTPEQKRQLVRALRKRGHTVAMTGDGVNDVLALKDADCSIAVASGSEAARQVSDVVLLNSNFACMPSVVGEGRRVIHNIQRSASLYLVKNIFSFVLALVTVCFTLPYPFTPAQISLVNCFTIGIPAFVLAMEPNRDRVEGRFLSNVLWAALPAALTDVVLIIGVILFYLAFGLGEGALSTICTGVMGTVGLLMVHNTCKPYTTLRRVLMGAMAAGFAVCFLFFGKWFALSGLVFSDLLVLVVLAGLAWPMLTLLTRAAQRLRALLTRRRKKRKA